MTTQSAETSNAAKVRMGGWYDMARSGGVKFIALGVSAVLGIRSPASSSPTLAPTFSLSTACLSALVRCFPSVCWALMRRSSTVLPSPMTSAGCPPAREVLVSSLRFFFCRRRSARHCVTDERLWSLGRIVG